MSATTTTPHRMVTNHEPSWWLRTQLDALPVKWQTSGVHTCPHVKRNRGVGINVTALYLPDVLACPECIGVFKVEGSADHQCDRCHEQADSLAGIVYDTAIEDMRLLVMFGLCPDCEARELEL
jgi:hypothetical protein